MVLGIREFTGKRLKEVQEFYSDNAREFKSASRILGKPNPNSIPRRPQSNSRTESRMGRTGDRIRAVLWVSRLWHMFWTFAGKYVCTMHNLTNVLKDGEFKDETFYKALTGDDAHGLRLYDFGAEISFVPPKSTNKTQESREKYESRGVPGIFLGYKLQPGGNGQDHTM